jgi:predicted nucleotidyltransferase
MKREIKKIAQQVTQLIAEGIQPKQIFLFGSYATGNETQDSDLDFFIVTDLQNSKKIDITQKARRLLIRKIYMPIDIIVCDTKNFETKKSDNTTLEYIVATEGIKLYG